MSQYFVIDNFTLIASAIILVFAIASSFLNPFIRFKKKKGNGKEENSNDSEAVEMGNTAPKLTVILTPHDEADRLERNLPFLLGQKYPSGFQVIVVIDESAHDTEDVLKRMQGQLNENPGDGSLYFSYIPDSSRYLSRKKLAITVGIKAATTEWVLITEASSIPSSDQWLATMAKECNDNNKLVVGYGNYSDESSSFKRFERLHSAYYLMREDVRGHAYRTLSHNLMFRKDDFMSKDGFLGNLNLIRGEYDFIVNKFATHDGTALIVDDEAWMIDEAPSKKEWMANHIFYMETRRWLSGGQRHRMWFNIDQIALHLSFLLVVAAIIYGAICLNATLLAASALSFILMITIRTIIGHKAMKSFHEKIPALLIYPYELSLVWHNLGYAIRYRWSNKLDFTTHKQ